MEREWLTDLVMGAALAGHYWAVDEELVVAAAATVEVAVEPVAS